MNNCSKTLLKTVNVSCILRLVKAAKEKTISLQVLQEESIKPKRFEKKLASRKEVADLKMTTPPSYPSTKDFKIPEYLKRDDLAVKAISLSQRNLIIRYNVSADMKGEIKILITGKWEADVQQLKNKAVKKGFAAENIDLLVKGFGHIYSGEAADTIAQIKDWARREAEAEKVAQAAGAQDGKKKPKVFKYYIQKYHDLAGGNELYEAVLIGSNKAAYFASIDREQSERACRAL